MYTIFRGIWPFLGAMVVLLAEIIAYVKGVSTVEAIFFGIPFNQDSLVKSHRSCQDGLWKKLDILGVVSETVIRRYMWYGQSPF